MNNHQPAPLTTRSGDAARPARLLVDTGNRLDEDHLHR